MGWFNESEDWILFQEGSGPDPGGESCSSGCGCLLLILIGFLVLVLFSK